MLIRSPPHALYMRLSARVENWGPSMHTMHLSVKSWTPWPCTARASRTWASSQRTSLDEKGSPKEAWATTEASKKVAGRTPLVRSMIWDGRTKDRGGMSSRREPTAEKARMARTPRDLRAAMLAREGTAEGGMVCAGPWRDRNAIWVGLEGREQMVMGELGKPQGCSNVSRHIQHQVELGTRCFWVDVFAGVMSESANGCKKTYRATDTTVRLSRW